MPLLSALKPGTTAEIVGFTQEAIGLKLLEMGCIPGEIIHVERVAPMGGPVAISVSGYQLAMRKSEASAMKVKILSNPTGR